MDEIQKEFAAFISREVKENANPYPTAIQAFRAGIEVERKCIIALLENELLVDEDGTIIETHLDALIALIKGENK